MASKTYRALTSAEIEQLATQGCCAEQWNNVEVADRFDSNNVWNVRFGGRVLLGEYSSTIIDSYGVERLTGVYNAHIIDCTIASNTLICNVSGYIANYDIGTGVIIEGLDRLVCSGESSFGCGVEVRTINEGGGREVAIYDQLSAQMAYITAMYRHRPKMMERLREIIAKRSRETASARGTIASGARVSGCGALININIAEGATVEGAGELSNGSLGKSAYVGTGVIASDFICAGGARVSDGSRLKRCFVGEGCVIESSFTAVDSLFFANCELSNGEAVSVFAAPYTVSHHRSSLLIAGYFSFFNAGSGANQSNHLFKTGAVHQGVHLRGCKFASNAYVMLPAREGAFTLVVGRHTNHHDTQHFPYSYLVEQEGKSYLHPAANLRSFGTSRDIDKWSRRDRRAGGQGLDRIHYDEYNPYIGEELRRAIALSQEMLNKSAETHSYKGVKITNSFLKRGVELYQLALDALAGAILESGERAGVTTKASKEWVDIAGMFAPKSEVDTIVERIESGALDSLESIEASFSELYSNYHAYAYHWALDVVGDEDIKATIKKGRQAAAALSKMRANDALRDSSEIMTTGYGIDCSEDAEADFRAVRKL